MSKEVNQRVRILNKKEDSNERKESLSTKQLEGYVCCLKDKIETLTEELRFYEQHLKATKEFT